MKSVVSPHQAPLAVAVLLATNIVTGLTTSRIVHACDFSEMNRNCLLNWEGIGANFEDTRVWKLPNVKPESEAEIYRMHEGNARFLVHYPKFSRRMGLDQNRLLTLFCWAVAAEDYRSDDIDIPIDPAVWRAFLTDGPKGLPLCWEVRESLTRAGAGQGLIQGEETSRHLMAHKPPPYTMGPLPKPYHPLPDEAAPS